MATLPKLERFKDQVLSRFQIYNSIFMTLPFDTIKRTTVFLPLFHETCVKGFKKGDDPVTIVNTFFKKYQARRPAESRIHLLFRFIQYIERQVVLFDAIEDASFSIVNNMDGIGTLRSLKEQAEVENKIDQLRKNLEEFKVRIVLTAHPTQFYPGTVLGIITELDQAVRRNDLKEITKLLAQLGKTPFFKREKPTPFDEAVSLIWYLENVFYKSVPSIYGYIQDNIFKGEAPKSSIMNIGFWPGGDRDGNPFVTPDITLNVARRLKKTIVKSYYKDAKDLRRKLTFNGVYQRIIDLETKLYELSFGDLTVKWELRDLKEELEFIRELVIKDHQSLYLEDINGLLNKIHLFGFYFAPLDIRQDSRIHSSIFEAIVQNTNLISKDYSELSEEQKMDILSNVSGTVDLNDFEDEFVKMSLQTMRCIPIIQAENGELGCNRYVISNNQTEVNVMELYAMLKITAFPGDMPVDIVPLFETITDLEAASDVMRKLYTNPTYAAHLESRNKKQTIMLGFSDGTKDGGYLMANWSIFRAKEELTAVSREFGIEVAFFDGRGGPPARGGGKTNQFYASLGPTISDTEIQLTIQGQTISSNFGTPESSQYNLEQLISAGIMNKLSGETLSLSDEDRQVMDELARISHQEYQDFKAHPKFIPYLENRSTLKYYAKTNIGSRPSKRSKSDSLVFSDLRAIPFVGSWSQLKQNVPGFFGVGTALQKFEERGDFDKVIGLYKRSSFFKTLIENSMMSLSKSFFPLTAYMAEDPEYGEFWKLIFAEYERSTNLILKLTGYTKLMENEPAGRESIQIRESIVLPLLTIQQYALIQIEELSKNKEENAEMIKVFEKMVTRSLYGNINASRNSA